MVELFREAEGVQLYEEPPVPESCVLLPEQIGLVVAEAVADGGESTVTVTVAVAEQLPFDTVTVYVVVTVGLAVGLLMVELFNEADGVQL
jgi:hypothetical protein